LRLVLEHLERLVAGNGREYHWIEAFLTEIAIRANTDEQSDEV
jgi:hypothetical protein